MIRFAPILAVFHLSLLFNAPFAQEKPPIIIKPKVAEEVRVALADFQPKNKNELSQVLNEALQTFNNVLWDDLAFCGWFTVENKALYPVTPISEPDHIKFPEWKASPLAVDFLAMGNAKIQGRDLILEARLYDIKTQAQVVGRKYTAAPDRARNLAHGFADEVVYYLTAGSSRGVASTQISFVSKRTGFKEIYVMDYDGSNIKPITNDRDINLMPAWSADNSKIAYISYRTRYPEINIKAILGQVRLSFPSFRSLASSPDFSPDGKSIAFASRSPETGMPNLYVASVDGSKRINITNSNSIDTAPSWSPTSRQIVFTSDRSGDNQLYIIDADGSNLRQITFEEGLKDSPDWSPDGRYVAFAWRPKQQPYFDLYLIDLMTNKTYQVTSNARNNENPAWAPDGRHIAFQSSRDGSDQIYVMVSDGTSVKKLTNGGVSNEAPAWSNYPPK